MKDEYAIVLDFLPSGYSNQRTESPIGILIGENSFTLLEVAAKEDTSFEQFEKVYIGNKNRDKVKTIKKRLNIEDLTGTARSELENAIKLIIKKNEKTFIDFFNTSSSASTRQHQIELLPGIGKKHMWEILKERKKKKFETFEDLQERVKLLPDPIKAIIKKIIEEIKQDSKYYLFTKNQKYDDY
jgi:putative nucleotide binding protein